MKIAIDDPLPKNIHQIQFWKLQIQTQSHCNARCTMCPYPQTKTQLEQGTMSWDLFCRVIDDLAQFPTLTSVVPMLQNEPLMNRRLTEEIRYIRDRRPDVRISITTNGELLDQEKINALIDAGLTDLVFSCSGLTEETLSVVERGVDARKKLENLDNLIDNRPSNLNVIVKTMIIRENAIELSVGHRVSSLFGRLKEAGIPIDFGPISNRAGALDGYEDMLIFAERQSSRKKLYCHDFFEGVYVLFNGDVLTCCPDWRRDGVVGNMKEQTFEEIWNGSPARNTRMAISESRYDDLTQCRGCSQAQNIMRNLETEGVPGSEA